MASLVSAEFEPPEVVGRFETGDPGIWGESVVERYSTL
jgi:hypothetical protein